ncbi:hypothetical protein NLJ89_g3808 [Agrocybe chaxingu]|uniref:Peptidase M24 domain-containing protein n=1 Tax=Agrocybe chaxingu TaxID=84603 RepID=A0A9W8K435_9AGAR|nr:hypothetical protein NLJ89_g3808 [Agrocybe chaxingu]
MKALIFVSLLVSCVVQAQFHPRQPAQYWPLPPLRTRASIQNNWTSERIARIPKLLKKYGAGAWLICQREHAEDTIWWSVKNATDFDAHRRTVLLFHTNDSSLAELRRVLDEYHPFRIVLNTDEDIAFAGGLHVGELAVLQRELGEYWTNRFVNEPMVAVEFVATKLPTLEYYRIMQENVWAMLEEGFSDKVIEPGVTTTEDLSWWFREKMQFLNISTWNQPRVSVLVEDSYPGWGGTEDVIEEGDILHIDFGITAMGLDTDTQHMAYVLRTSGAEPETDVPDSLKEGLRKANQLQEIVLGNMKPGLSGNTVLHQSDWGHDAGSVIGFLNLPEYVPVLGELPILPNTYYSVGLYAYHFVPERNEAIRFRLEENVAWSDESQKWERLSHELENPTMQA